MATDKTMASQAVTELLPKLAGFIDEKLWEAAGQRIAFLIVVHCDGTSQHMCNLEADGTIELAQGVITNMTSNDTADIKS